MYRVVIIVALALVGTSSALEARDPLLAEKGEIPFAPVAVNVAIEGIPVTLQAYGFLRLVDDADRIALDARVVADLGDLQRQIGPIVGRLRLPNNNCANRGIDQLNYVVRLERQYLGLRNQQARLELGGKLAVWSCFSLFGQRVLNRNFEDRFDASVHTQLVPQGSALRLEVGTPQVSLRGDVGDFLLRLLGGDSLGRELRSFLNQALGQKNLLAGLPQGLLDLEPRIGAARFIMLGDRLGAEATLHLRLDREAFMVGEVRPMRELSTGN